MECECTVRVGVDMEILPQPTTPQIHDSARDDFKLRKRRYGTPRIGRALETETNLGGPFCSCNPQPTHLVLLPSFQPAHQRTCNCGRQGLLDATLSLHMLN